MFPGGARGLGSTASFQGDGGELLKKAGFRDPQQSFPTRHWGEGGTGTPRTPTDSPGTALNRGLGGGGDRDSGLGVDLGLGGLRLGLGGLERRLGRSGIDMGLGLGGLDMVWAWVWVLDPMQFWGLRREWDS